MSTSATSSKQGRARKAQAQRAHTREAGERLIERLGAGKITFATALRAPEARALRVAELLMSRPYLGPQRAKRRLIDAGLEIEVRCGELEEAELERLAPSEGTMALKAKIAVGAIGLAEALASSEARILHVEEVLLARPNARTGRIEAILDAAGVGAGTFCGQLSEAQTEAIVDEATPRRRRPCERSTKTEAPKVAPVRRDTVEGLTLEERLRVQQAEREALQRMSRAERRNTYERGELTPYQRSLLATFTDEVVVRTKQGETVRLTQSQPQIGLVNGELPWIVAKLADLDPD